MTHLWSLGEMWRLCVSICVYSLCAVSILHVGMLALQASGLPVCQFRGCVVCVIQAGCHCVVRCI